MATYIIGTDNNLPADQNRDVRIVSLYGEVSIVGPFEGWMGYKTLESFDPECDDDEHIEAADALAKRIADGDTVAELAALGYDASGWLRVLNPAIAI